MTMFLPRVLRQSRLGLISAWLIYTLELERAVLDYS